MNIFSFTQLIGFNFLASKKCAHVLKALFNYLKFYQMAKNDVINKANEQLAKYNDVLNKKNDLESKIEKNRKRGEKVRRSIKVMMKCHITVTTLTLQLYSD